MTTRLDPLKGGVANVGDLSETGVGLVRIDGSRRVAGPDGHLPINTIIVGMPAQPDGQAITVDSDGSGGMQVIPPEEATFDFQGMSRETR